MIPRVRIYFSLLLVALTVRAIEGPSIVSKAGI